MRFSNSTNLGIPEENVFYVGKHGDDANNGLSIDQAVLTFGQAETLAAAQSPGDSNRFAIVCLDSGIYTEDISCNGYVNIDAPNATLDGTITLADQVTIRFNRQLVADTEVGITKTSDGVNYIHINEVICDLTGSWISTSDGNLSLIWDFISMTTGTCFNTSGGTIGINGGIIYFQDDAVGFTGTGGGIIVGNFEGVGGSGLGTAFDGSDEVTMIINAGGSINCDTAIDISHADANINLSLNVIIAASTAYTMSAGLLNLVCNSIASGARTVTGGTENVTVANPMGTAGQIWTSSGTGVDPQWADITSTTLDIDVAIPGTVEVETKAVLQTDTGFGSWAAAGPYFDDTTLGSFTVLVGGTGYINGVPITWSGSQTVTGMTAGNTYYIYIDNTGTLQKTDTRTDALFQDNIVLFECMRDSTSPTNIQVTEKENHPYQFPVAPSNFLHATAGTVIENINLGANITLNGTAAIQINGTDYLNDHGLRTTIPDSGGAAISWRFYYTNASGKWARYTTATTFPAYWNNAGTSTALTGTRRCIFNLYVGKDSLNSTAPIYFALLDTIDYSGLAAATAAMNAGTYVKATGELAGLEVAQLGQVIYGKNDDTIQLVNVNKTTIRSVSTSGGATAANLITVTTTNFDGVLSPTDTNVQIALETIDEYRGGLYTVTATTNATMVVNRRYIIKNTVPSNLTTLTLPATAILGDTIAVLGYTSGGWRISQNANQKIYFGTASTTTGATGYLASSNTNDTVRIECVTAGASTEWIVTSSVGDITYA